MNKKELYKCPCIAYNVLCGKKNYINVLVLPIMFYVVISQSGIEIVCNITTPAIPHLVKDFSSTLQNRKNNEKNGSNFST